MLSISCTVGGFDSGNSLVWYLCGHQNLVQTRWCRCEQSILCLNADRTTCFEAFAWGRALASAALHYSAGNIKVCRVYQDKHQQINYILCVAQTHLEMLVACNLNGEEDQVYKMMMVCLMCGLKRAPSARA